MLHDPRDIPVTTIVPDAAAALEASVLALLAHRADVPAHLARCLAADPGLVAAHALAGFSARMQARQELEATAATHLAAARAGLAERGGTARERGLVAALAAWQEDGDMLAAAGHLGRLTRAAPRDAMALKLEHGLRFMLGDASGMRDAMAAAASGWTADMPGFGYMLGLHAFALEETGAPAAAERLGRDAVAAAPDDLWGGHAVAHVMEGAGRAREGLDWIGGMRGHLADGGGFGRHVLWHAALFHLHLGQVEAALDLHDHCIHDRPAEDVRDFANAASLLWRIEAQGIAVGQARWDALADIAARRSAEPGLAFIDLHHVLALGAAGRRQALADKLEALRLRAAAGADTQGEVLARCGLPAARAIALARGGDPAGAVDLLLPLRQALRDLGGSGAQRDLFDRLLIDACLASGRIITAAMLLEDREAIRALGAWEAGCARTIRSAMAPRGRQVIPAKASTSLVGPQTINRSPSTMGVSAWA
ncbi:tetratricopeptide repeat protein [Humitalea sp. 24SJ18S-53]|uniref:tetratricopeptide repeat protein n=1 Tax=Humitalea sp. 24SJ18S-53 TaxID=3422307 RepID=UPI003D6670A2